MRAEGSGYRWLKFGGGFFAAAMHAGGTEAIKIFAYMLSFIFSKRTSFYLFVLLIMAGVKTLYSRAILLIIHET